MPMRGTAAAALLLMPLLLHAAVAAGNGSCERTCGASTVQYPFGFSPGCEIRLGCDDQANGTAWLGAERELRLLVSNVTARAIILALPLDCSRPLNASVDALFSDSYAPDGHNTLVVRDCSSSDSARTARLRCTVRRTAAYLNSSSYCFHNASAENISCIPPPQPPSGNGFLNRSEMVALGSECPGLVSAVRASDEALLLSTMALEWWVNGPCRCSPRANCTLVTTPTAGQGFRCECLEGLVGDGFTDGAGCRRGLPVARSITHKLLTIIILSASTGLTICLIILSTLARLFWRPRRQKRAKKMAQKGFREESLSNDEAMDDELKNEAGPKRFRYDELSAATDNFSDEQKLGEGGFGSVYRGFLEGENLQVAIKRVSRSSKQGRKEYVSEVKIISRLRHRNLVQLIGWCHDG